jgi:putrescine transport system ATP-binding protein
MGSDIAPARPPDHNHDPRPHGDRSLAIGAVRRSFAPWLDPTAKPLVRFENVVKAFGDTRAVDGVTLDIHEREFFCLLGPSGCGKTTLMRMLGGFEAPTSGRILLGGEDITAVPPHRRPVNMMFQSYALFPHMSVEANIGFGLREEGMSRDAIQTRVGELIRLVQLQGMERRRPDQLSGGQKQRVALARALAKRPKVLLLDEPLGALDKKLREETQFELMDLQVNLGMTFLMVTHDQEEAMTMADRIGIMNRGRLVQIDTPGQIYEQPADRYVAEFMGDVNILEGVIEGRGDDGLWHIAGDTDIGAMLIDDADEVLATGQRVAVAIRPEKMRVEAASEQVAPNTLRGEVWDIGYLGDWTVYRVRLPSGQVVKVSRANATRHVERPITWDDQVQISFAPSAGVILAG